MSGLPLADRFTRLLQRLSVRSGQPQPLPAPQAERWLTAIRDAYGAPERRYHSLAHLDALFDCCDKWCVRCVAERETELFWPVLNVLKGWRAQGPGLCAASHFVPRRCLPH